MNQKIELTKKVLETLGMESAPNQVRKTIPVWWYSTRQKEKGGLRLTEQGFEALKTADIRNYRIQFEESIFLSNQLVIWLDQFIDCPFYLTQKEIYVFSERIAVELVLFSGNIYKFFKAKSSRQSA